MLWVIEVTKKSGDERKVQQNKETIQKFSHFYWKRTGCTYISSLPPQPVSARLLDAMKSKIGKWLWVIFSWLRDAQLAKI